MQQNIFSFILVIESSQYFLFRTKMDSTITQYDYISCSSFFPNPLPNPLHTKINSDNPDIRIIREVKHKL